MIYILLIVLYISTISVILFVCFSLELGKNNQKPSHAAGKALLWHYMRSFAAEKWFRRCFILVTVSQLHITAQLICNSL